MALEVNGQVRSVVKNLGDAADCKLSRKCCREGGKHAAYYGQIIICEMNMQSALTQPILGSAPQERWGPLGANPDQLSALLSLFEL